MVYETRECLRWIKDEIAEFGGDRKRVWVLGHGAGAHVGLLSVVQSAVVCLREKELAEREERNERRRKREAEVGRDSLDGRETQGEKKRWVVEPSQDSFATDLRASNLSQSFLSRPIP